MACWLGIIVLAGGLLGRLAAQTQDANTPLYFAHRSFQLPFQLNQVQGTVREVVVYAYERGRDRRWRQVGRALPTQKLPVRLDADGDYLFAAQIQFTDGKASPANVDDLAATTRIIVDTIRPDIRLRAIQGRNSSTAGVDWSIQDANLELTSIRLECRYLGQKRDWFNITDGFRPASRGDYLWSLRPGQQLEVRMRAQDRAGNEAVSATVVTPPSGKPTTVREPMQRDMAARPAYTTKVDHYLPRKAVELNVTIESGKSGLSTVDLFVTRGDQSGTLWEQVNNALQPAKSDRPPDGSGQGLERRVLRYDAPSEGLYGFVIVPRSGVGLAERPPQPGDPPQVWVEVDQTPPQLDILDVRVVPSDPGGEHGNQVIIRWQATDKNLENQPIDIEVSEQAPKLNSGQQTDAQNVPSGQWKSIATKLDNRGEYRWTPPNTDPFKFWVRVRAIDRASNMTPKVWPKPVIIDLQKPKVNRIQVETIFDPPSS